MERLRPDCFGGLFQQQRRVVVVATNKLAAALDEGRIRKGNEVRRGAHLPFYHGFFEPLFGAKPSRFCRARQPA